MQNDAEWTKKYYTPEVQAKVDARKELWSPMLQAEVSLKWSQLFADIETAITDGEDPAGPRAALLAMRWRDLLAGFTGGVRISRRVSTGCGRTSRTGRRLSERATRSRQRSMTSSCRR